MFKKYLDYLLDNPNHYWFKRKIWGWGWIPVTWQGWVTTLLYIALILLLVCSREELILGNPDSGSNFLVFGLPILLLTAAFIFILYKTGEKPKWQWGLPEDKLLNNNLSYMEKLTFKIVINASSEKVWHTMLDDVTYQEWTKPFNEGSCYVGKWETGSEMRFIGVDNQGQVLGGMYSKIKEARPYEFISIEHLGLITETGEVDTTSEAVKQWTPAFENYTFNETKEGTEIVVDIDVSDEWKEMFNGMWPKALAKLKEIVERS